MHDQAPTLARDAARNVVAATDSALISAASELFQRLACGTENNHVCVWLALYSLVPFPRLSFCSGRVCGPLVHEKCGPGNHKFQTYMSRILRIVRRVRRGKPDHYL
jgi:hypothetical protein